MEEQMLKNSLSGIAVMFACFSISAQPATSAQGPEVVRKVLMQHDLPMPGWSEALVYVEIPVGGREGRHTHPGPLLVRSEERRVGKECRSRGCAERDK